MKSLVMGVPQTYPPKPLEGCMITSFLTPDINSEFTWPPELKKEVLDLVDGDYPFDVNLYVFYHAWVNENHPRAGPPQPRG